MGVGVNEIIFYYEQHIKRDLKRIHIRGRRWNERLKAKSDGSVTGLYGELQHLKRDTRLLIR